MNSESATDEALDEVYYEVAKPRSLAERVVIAARDRIYQDFLRVCRPTAEDRILDVGVSDVVTDAANMLERLYPYPERITAAGLGPPTEFRKAFPGVRYQQIGADLPLPFDDGSFDIVTSNAVLEHVGSPDSQRRLLGELLRVGCRVFVTVPHRFFPIEHHTALPIVHWTDWSFGLACRLSGKSYWSRTENLILMSRRKLGGLCSDSLRPEIGRTGIRLGPFSSNLMLYAETRGSLGNRDAR